VFGVKTKWSGAYDFGVPGAKEDYIPQTTPPSAVVGSKVEKS